MAGLALPEKMFLDQFLTSYQTVLNAVTTLVLLGAFVYFSKQGYQALIGSDEKGRSCFDKSTSTRNSWILGATETLTGWQTRELLLKLERKGDSTKLTQESKENTKSEFDLRKERACKELERIKRLVHESRQAHREAVELRQKETSLEEAKHVLLPMKQVCEAESFTFTDAEFEELESTIEVLKGLGTEAEEMEKKQLVKVTEAIGEYRRRFATLEEALFSEIYETVEADVASSEHVTLVSWKHGSF